MTLTPRPYQIEGRDFLASRRFALLADEMRVGKTPQAILAAKQVGAGSVCVVCPAIAVTQWEREFDRWWPGHGLLRVVSFDRLRLAPHELLDHSWDVAIVDECHFAKNPAAQRTKLIYGAHGLGWHTNYMWALSGTPATKHAGELWPMLRAFGATKLAYPTFLRTYCTGFYHKKRREWVPTGTRADTLPELRGMLGRIMLRRMRKDVAPDMPGIDFQFLETKIVGADLRISPDDFGTDPAAWASAHSNDAGMREDRQAVARAKVLPLSESIRFAIGNDLLKQTVVFGWHTEPLAELRTTLVNADLNVGLITGATSRRERDNIQQKFLCGKIQVVIANIMAAGTAIDLSAASHGYFLELDWVPGNNAQAANRLVSMQKQEPVTFDIVTWPGSTDDKVQRALLTRVREIAKLYC